MSGLTQRDISRFAAELGFSAAYCCAPLPTDGAPEDVKTLAILTRAYTPGGLLVDRFYPAGNAAYHAARELARRIAAKYGVEAVHLPHVRLKPLCGRHPAFGAGRNTLNYLPGIGSRFCMELIGLAAVVPAEEAPAYDDALLPCRACRRCMQACPTGAITEAGFIKEKCIRFYMLSGKPMPIEMRPLIGSLTGVRGIVGCDICQRVCPANAEMEKRRTQEDELTLTELLTCDANTMERFAALYGKNYANRNRVLAQAILTAANTGNAEYLQIITTFKDSPSALVAEHAAWATDILKK